MRNLVLAALTPVVLMLTPACGRVSQGPIDPLLNPPVAYSFDQGLEGWAILAGSIPATGSAFSHSTDRALGTGGSMRIDAAFTAVGDKVLTGLTLPVTLDMTGKTISCWVYWESGLAAEGGKVGAQVYVMDANSVWANGTFAALTRGKWTQATFNTAAPGYSDGAKMDLVTRLGVQIVADAGAFTPGTIYLDQFAY
jgi:hypothetical protein